MSTEIIVSIISGLFTIIGVILTVCINNSKTLYRIEQLEKKQDKHNNLIERMYQVEKKQELSEQKNKEERELFEEKLKVANHRIEDIECKLQ